MVLIGEKFWIPYNRSNMHGFSMKLGPLQVCCELKLSVTVQELSVGLIHYTIQLITAS